MLFWDGHFVGTWKKKITKEKVKNEKGKKTSAMEQKRQVSLTKARRASSPGEPTLRQFIQRQLLLLGQASINVVENMEIFFSTGKIRHPVRLSQEACFLTAKMTWQCNYQKDNSCECWRGPEWGLCLRDCSCCHRLQTAPWSFTFRPGEDALFWSSCGHL